MGLIAGDLKHLVYDIFEIDSFKSKMGDDKNIVVLSLSARTKESANDLMNFLEKGYPFVLDADVTSGEQADGSYKVFVELERNKDIPDQIVEIVDGVKKLSDLDEMRFRYYKSFQSSPVDVQTVSETVPIEKAAYDIKVNESNMENYKNFFNKSYMEDLYVFNENLHVKKKYADTLVFEIVDFGKTEDIQKEITENFNVNSFAEIIFLTKYLGDYNISKYGDKILIENNGYTVVTLRK